MTGAAPADRIRLRGLRLIGTHGVLPEEHERAQPFEVDLEIVADLARPGRSDALQDTIDYGAVTAAVAGVVGGEHADLLEHLAERIADATFDVAGGAAFEVAVTVRKLRPPVAHDLAVSEVTIRRRNPGGSSGR
ncbi:MAG: dihydroneopterin aldolase [Acidimicrobiaceae bacterium]|nr:dihydroneopterin aldolase [Acidimicrobiaceae bacterium]